MERLRYFVLLWLLICFVSIASTQEKEGKIFGSFDEYNSYVFGNSDLRTLTNGYFLNYVPEMTPDEAQKLFSLYDKRVITRESMLNFITLLERTDVSRQLKADSLLFPVMNEVFSNDGKHRLRIPIFINDVIVSYLNTESFDDVIMKHKGEQPFDGLTRNQIGNKQLTFSGLFIDTLVNNHISIYWNRETVISNTRKRIENLRMIIDKDTFNIPENEEFALDNYYGYPHLAHPTDHYMSYTPFDAVFAWEEENTVHIQSGHAFWNDNKENGCSQGFFDAVGQYNPKRWEQHDATVRNEIRSFILSEADTYNTFVQNRRYGDNASLNAIYKADIISKHQLYAGENVTQRTDFKEVTIEPNADVRFVACEAIHLRPGFHAKAGS